MSKAGVSGDGGRDGRRRAPGAMGGSVRDGCGVSMDGGERALDGYTVGVWTQLERTGARGAT